MELLERIAYCIEFGKIDQNSPYPPNMKGEEGADELTRKALDSGISPERILTEGMVAAMERVGKKFSENKIFVPQMLIAAKAMGASMKHIKPFFQSGSVKRKGKFIIGTVVGDLHDIGKNLVAMMVEGAGFEVIDLGVDVKPEKFIEALRTNPGSYVGLSALLTTTMVNMEEIVKAIKKENATTKVLVGGAPLNEDFCMKIGADCYSSSPQGAVDYLNRMTA